MTSTAMTEQPRTDSSLEAAGTFVVFGASGGIGSAVCRRLAARGASLALCGRDGDTLGALANEVGGATVAVDATDFDAVDRCFEQAAADGTPLAGAVNCVGSILLKPAHLTSFDEWAEAVRLNLTSAFAVVRAAGKHMKSGGSVVLVSSVAGATGLGNHEAIAAVKGGVSSLVRAAAATYAARGLRFNAVSPGLVQTPLTERITSNEASREASKRMHPLQRLGEPDDIASAIAWLLDPANSWVTGQTIGVDGGLGAIRPKG